MPLAVRASLIAALLLLVSFVRSFWWADFVGWRTSLAEPSPSAGWSAKYRRVGVARGLVLCGNESFATRWQFCSHAFPIQRVRYPSFEYECASPGAEIFWTLLAPSWNETTLGFGRHLPPRDYQLTNRTMGTWIPAVSIPLWPPILLTAVPWLRWSWQRSRRHAQCHCLRCGYDLLASSNIRPEGGEPIRAISGADFLAQW